MLYTPMPIEMIFGDPYSTDQGTEMVIMDHKGVKVLARRNRNTMGHGRIERVLSTDPQDYLNPELAPGTIIHL